MTQSDSASLARQAHNAAERVSRWPAWRQELAARAAREPGTDVEPGVNAVVVRAVERALQSDSTSERQPDGG
jgi:hypothetical protein